MVFFNCYSISPQLLFSCSSIVLQFFLYCSSAALQLQVDWGGSDRTSDHIFITHYRVKSGEQLPQLEWRGDLDFAVSKNHGEQFKRFYAFSSYSNTFSSNVSVL